MGHLFISHSVPACKVWWVSTGERTAKKDNGICRVPHSVREYAFYVFSDFNKRVFLRFFEMAYQKVVKSL